MDIQLRDRVVMVTGGASGIGRACVDLLASEGANILIVDRNPDGAAAAEQLRNDGRQVSFVQADLTVEADVRMLAEAVEDLYGGLDSVIACAGISGPVGQNATDVSAEDWDRVMAVNVRGNFLLAKYCVPLLRDSAVASMVFLGSDSAFVAYEGMAPYTASKGAVVMLTKALAVDHPQIRFNCLCPGIVDTPMSRADLGFDDGFAGSGLPVIEPRQIAGHALFLASPVSAPVNGTTLIADFGYIARSAQPSLDFTASPST